MDKTLQKGNAMLIGIIVLVVIAGIGGYFWFSGKNKANMEDAMENVSPSPAMSESPNISPEASASASPSVSPSTSPSPSSMSQTKEFMVVGVPFKLTPAEIRVKKGDKVRIVFKNESGFHDWVLDEFNVRTKQLQVGQTDTVEFVASRTGTFEYYCSVGTHRQMGMKGNLIVE